ncbi:MAG: methyl-accepting chemotaxis protein [Candidatus Kariarchaeaceae archaeon]
MALDLVDYIGIIASIIGLIAFIFAIYYQTDIVRLLLKSHFVKYWKVVRLLTLFFCIGYIVQIISILFELTNLIEWMVPLVYLFGGLFVFLISFLNTVTSKERATYVSSMEQLQRDLLELVEQSMDGISVITSSVETLLSTSNKVASISNLVTGTSRAISTGTVQQTAMIETIVQELRTARKDIEDILYEIDENTESILDIGDNSNVLAINAIISAKRAGDYGREFRVVAENFKTFSDETNSAAQNVRNVSFEITRILESEINLIASNIESMVSVSQQTSVASQDLVTSSEEMNSLVKDLTSLVEHLRNQAAKTSQIVEQINK